MKMFNEVFDFEIERVFFNLGCSVETSPGYSMLMERRSSKFLSVRGITV